MVEKRSEPIILLENVDKTFHDISFKDRYILNNVNLEISKGDFAAIIGPSGSGKSTLLHMIAGIENPTAGQITVLDETLNNLNEVVSRPFFE